MQKARRLANIVLVGNAAIWATVIRMTARVLRDTAYHGDVRAILAGGVIASILLAGALRPRR